MQKKQKIIIIGASTGGPGHIQKILQSINASTNTSFIIVQHMNSAYIESFTENLKSYTTLTLRETTDNTIIQPAQIYVCKQNMELRQISTSEFSLVYSAKETTYVPSIDLLLESFTEYTQNIDLTVIILTGIGDDGAYGASLLEKKGVNIIAESSQSAKVYGMPYQTAHICNQVTILSLTQICDYISKV